MAVAKKASRGPEVSHALVKTTGTAATAGRRGEGAAGAPGQRE